MDEKDFADLRMKSCSCLLQTERDPFRYLLTLGLVRVSAGILEDCTPPPSKKDV